MTLKEFKDLQNEINEATWAFHKENYTRAIHLASKAKIKLHNLIKQSKKRLNENPGS